jgi:uncharacterized protein (DUF2267 family)
VKYHEFLAKVHDRGEYANTEHAAQVRQVILAHRVSSCPTGEAKDLAAAPHPAVIACAPAVPAVAPAATAHWLLLRRPTRVEPTDHRARLRLTQGYRDSGARVATR